MSALGLRERMGNGIEMVERELALRADEWTAVAPPAR
jgi:hypothetical protein